MNLIEITEFIKKINDLVEKKCNVRFNLYPEGIYLDNTLGLDIAWRHDNGNVQGYHAFFRLNNDIEDQMDLFWIEFEQAARQMLLDGNKETWSDEQFLSERGIVLNPIKQHYESKKKQMGPKYGTEEYQNQVETIKMRLSDVKDLIQKNPEIINQILMMFITDHAYSRPAICQAEKEWKSVNG